jgi:hypothetical protein
VRRAALPLLALAFLSGCKVAGDIAGIAAAAGSGSATANPAVGIAVGIAVRSGVDALVDYIDRRRHEGEQDAIAETAGATPIGTARAWVIHHTIPIGNEHGMLEPVREFTTPLTTCREIAFTVVDGADRDHPLPRRRHLALGRRRARSPPLGLPAVTPCPCSLSRWRERAGVRVAPQPRQSQHPTPPPPKPARNRGIAAAAPAC